VNHQGTTFISLWLSEGSGARRSIMDTCLADEMMGENSVLDTKL